MITIDYAFRHLELVWDMVRGHDDAVDEMDISADGFWRSFWAIPLSLPALLFAWTINARSDIGSGVEMSMSALVGMDAVFDTGLWIGLAALFMVLLPRIGFGPRMAHFIIARNWLTLLLSYALALMMIPELFNASSMPTYTIILLAVFVTFIGLYIRVTRQALRSSFSIAFALVMADLLLTIFASELFYSALTASPAS